MILLRFIKKVLKLSDLIKKYWILLISEILILIVFCLFYGRFGDIMVDSFREAYIPEQMLNGSILYKDIFCIYPPLGYLINEFLYKIFGVNLYVIYFSGLISALGIFYFLNKILNIFLDKLIIAGINLFLIAGLILSPNVFNIFLPYSSGIVYGLLFSMASIYFALNKKFPLAYLLCGLAICSKAEFLFLFPALLYFSKKESFLKNILAFISPFFAVLGILLIQGIRPSDLLTALYTIQLIGSTDTLQNFYFSMGLVPNIAHVPLYLINFVKFILPINWSLYQEILIWGFPVMAILFAFRYKNLSVRERFLVILSILVSLKVFFGLTIQSYGVYFLPFCLLPIALLLKGNFRKVFGILLIIWALIIGFNNAKILSAKNYILDSSRGIVKVDPSIGKSIDEIIRFVNSVPSNSTVVVYPECLAVNYFSERKSDNKFYSLIPLYIETFGEETILKRLEKFPPDYIIVSNYDTFAYGYSHFGKDYGVKTYEYIIKNYNKTKEFNDSYKVYYKNPA